MQKKRDGTHRFYVENLNEEKNHVERGDLRVFGEIRITIIALLLLSYSLFLTWFALGFAIYGIYIVEDRGMNPSLLIAPLRQLLSQFHLLNSNT